MQAAFAVVAARSNTDTHHKASLKFIMNDNVGDEPADRHDRREPEAISDSASAASSEPDDALPAAAVGEAAGLRPPRARKPRSAASNEKRRARECRIDGCDKYIINRGLCFRHGGGKKCSVTECTSSAKNAGLCWRHGGSVKCLMDGCERRGKSRGLCWAHGGGTKCSSDECAKVAVSNGYCWAHGGGKRCSFDGCRRAAYERTHNYCNRHYEELRDGDRTVHL